MTNPTQSGGQGTEKLWGGRFESPQDPLFERLCASIGFDHVLAPYDIRGSRAHVRMLAEIGVIAPQERDRILAGLDQVEEEIKSGAFHWSTKDEDIHMAVERRLTELIGPVAGKLHTGRSRNDQVILDLHLYLRSAIEGHLERLTQLMAALLDQAEINKQVIIPGYTHMQRAQPILAAHHLLAYFFAFERDRQRLADWKRYSWMPLGAGALAGANYPLDRERVARELGFAEVAPNAMDAVAARDAAFMYLAIVACCALTLSRLATEIVLWTTQEYGFVTLPEAWTSGSSIMPQKRNADAAEIIRAKTAGFLARLQGLGAVLKGLPMAYNSDLQEDKLYVFASREEFDLCLEAMTGMVRHLVFDKERTREAAEGGYSQATDVADYLVRKGLPFRQAHRVVGRLVASLAKEKRAFSQVSLEELKAFSPLFDEEFYQVVDLDRVVAGKISPGGTAPSRVEEQLALARRMLGLSA
ncbi:MAG: argininosuccinate lyase [Thermoleophilia bacterium]|nr:argininosuccinate lyase [Thermoleophilia bacterium]